MFNKSKTKQLVPAAFLLAGVFGVAAPAHAILVNGHLDPQYGAPFQSGTSALGWSADANWLVADTCSSLSGTGTIANGGSCAMSFLGATVTFYNMTNGVAIPNSTIATLTFGPTQANGFVQDMIVSNGAVVGVDTLLSFGVLPSLTGYTPNYGVGAYQWGLRYTGTTRAIDGGAKLFYASNSSFAATLLSGSQPSGEHENEHDDCDDDDDDECAPKPCSLGDTNVVGCGVNDFANFKPQMTFTVTSVPEPQTYALMLAGLAAIGFVARRRRQA